MAHGGQQQTRGLASIKDFFKGKDILPEEDLKANAKNNLIQQSDDYEAIKTIELVSWRKIKIFVC
jgi:hypothetical protein